MRARDRFTPSGIAVPPVATAADHELATAAPGEYPYTRGIFSDGYRGRLWTFRQYSGFGSAEESNARYRFLLERGQTGLSVALDLPTQCGYDPIDPMAMAEVGKVGVSVSTLADMERLFQGIDLSQVSTSFTINGTAAMIFAMYLACADKAGVAREQLTGTIQNDILKEYVARGTWIFPVRPALRLVADSIVYANRVAPRFNPISIAGAHVRDAGASAVEEMGFTLANGLAYVDELIARGADLEEFATRLSFFFYVHMNLFEEVAKFRAARRLWARLMKERYAARSARAQHFRFGVVCGGSSLTAAQPLNNVVRVAIETLAASFGGAQSIFTCAYDEAFQLPSEESAELALRTQQVIAYESGIADSVDPLGGSHWKKSYRALRHTGRLGMFGISTATESRLPGPLKFLGVALGLPWFNPISLMNDNRAVFGVNLGHLWHEQDKVRRWMDALLAGVVDGWLRPHVDRAFELEQAGEAHAYIEARRNIGKVVLVP